MNRKLSITLAAALAAGGLVFGIGLDARAEDKAAEAGQNDPATAAQEGNQAASSSSSSATPATFPPGVKVDDDPAEERGDLFKTFTTLTQAALEKDGFDDVVERLVDQDRNRIGQDNFAEQKFDDLNAQADAIRAAWKAKYGDDFKVEGEQAFAKLAAVVGKIDDPKAVASAWPVPAVTDAAGAEAVPASAKETEGNQDPNLNSNVEKGRGVAIATIPASHGLPALNVSLIDELQGWRVDVPNTLSGQQLHDSLLKHLTHVSQMQAQWPADKNEAALMVAHHVLLGAYGVDVEPGAQQDGQPPSGAAGKSTDAADQK